MNFTKQIGWVIAGIFCLFSVRADVINIKADAPTRYVVKKGDTLWDISGIYLEQPWLWPELWRNNTQIENPHLIFPGDVLKLRFVDGQPVIEVIRDKKRIALSPDKTVTAKQAAISVLPWAHLAPYFSDESIMDEDEYESLPYLLGDSDGSPSFTSKDFVISKEINEQATLFNVVRQQEEVHDSSGQFIGVQVDVLADAELISSESGATQVVRINDSMREARQGDKLIPAKHVHETQIELSAATTQTGELVRNVNGRTLVGKHDLVIINLGKSEIGVGTVMGIYKKGPDIIDGERPTYMREASLTPFSDTIEQPAFKQGELVVVKTFDRASYAWITRANTYFEGGEFLAKP